MSTIEYLSKQSCVGIVQVDYEARSRFYRQLSIDLKALISRNDLKRFSQRSDHEVGDDSETLHGLSKLGIDLRIQAVRVPGCFSQLFQRQIYDLHHWPPCLG